MLRAKLTQLLKDTDSIVLNDYSISDNDYINLVEWRGELREICSKSFIPVGTKIPVCPVSVKDKPVDN